MPIVATDYKSMVGPVKWTGQPVKNVTKTPLVAGQWQRKGDKFDLVITTNKTAPEIPVGRTAAAVVVSWRRARCCNLGRDVVPAKAGTHAALNRGLWNMDPRLRGDDNR